MEFLRAEVQSVLRLASPPPAEVGFLDLGLDSLMAVELRDRLNRAFAGEYEAPSTLVFDYPNVVRLARHLVAQVSGSPQTGEVPKPASYRAVRRGSNRGRRHGVPLPRGSGPVRVLEATGIGRRRRDEGTPRAT